MGILDRVRSTRDLDHSYFNMLVYGPPGTGKTFLARTAVAAGHRVLLLDADHGTMTLRDQDVASLPVSSYDDLIEVYKELAEPGHGYDTVFIDNLSEIQKLLIDRLKAQHGRKFGLHSWAQIVEKTSAVCRIYRSLSMNVVVLSHSMEIEDENRVRIRPAISGKKLPHEIGGLFDLVGYSHTAVGRRGGVSFRIGFATVGDRHITKDRSGRLDDVEPNDFGLLYRKVFPEAAQVRQGRLVVATSRPIAASSGLLSEASAGAPVEDVSAAIVADVAATSATPATTAASSEALSAAVQAAAAAAAAAAADLVRSRAEQASLKGPVKALKTLAEARAERADIVEPLNREVEEAPAVSGQLALAPERHASRDRVAGDLAAKGGLEPATLVEVKSTPMPAKSAQPASVVIQAASSSAAEGVSEPQLRAAAASLEEGSYGTAAWHAASTRFREVLHQLSDNDAERMRAIIAFVKQTQRVKSSAEMKASEILAWCERLLFMSQAGDLEEFLEEVTL